MARHTCRNYQAESSFSELLDHVAVSGSAPRSELLAALEGLLERLQTPAARSGMEAAFHADPAALGQAAAKAARRQR